MYPLQNHPFFGRIKKNSHPARGFSLCWTKNYSIAQKDPKIPTRQHCFGFLQPSAGCSITFISCKCDVFLGVGLKVSAERNKQIFGSCQFVRTETARVTWKVNRLRRNFCRGSYLYFMRFRVKWEKGFFWVENLETKRGKRSFDWMFFGKLWQLMN